MPSAYHKSPENQTHEEWLEDYSRSSGDIDKQPNIPSWRDRGNDDTTHEFRYIDHRTIRTGGLAMDFEILDHKLKATLFFNVNLISKYGTRYPSGDHGQFNPPANGKFRQFWIQAVGKPPYRWSRVHKSMRSSLRGLVFVGKIKPEIDSKGRPYNKIIEIWPK